ncbi:MAG: hypothetical protein R3C58_07435 [Parvularculaceae bacterium]
MMRLPQRSNPARSSPLVSTSIRRSRTVPAALLALENVVLLPHLGSATEETREAMGMRAAANVDAFAVSGAPLPDRVV